MAVNQSRSMLDDFSQGVIDSSYISITPDRGGVLGSVPTERLDWPGYERAECHKCDPFEEHMQHHVNRPMERKVAY